MATRAFNLRSIIAEMLAPSDRDERPYLSMLLAIAHAVLGAALSVLTWGPGAATAVRVASIYWLTKEQSDLRKGGTIRDGLIDAAFVFAGAFYGHDLWPAAILFAALVVAIL